MIERIIKIVFRFVLLVSIQALVLNNIRLGGFVNPYMYVLFILLMPIETPSWLLMTISFFLGLSIDLFTNTYGMHAAACVFMAFCRPWLLKVMAPRESYEPEKPPSMQYMGFSWFVIYAGILVLMHHLVLFYLEVFRMSEFFSTLMRVLLSTILTMVLILLTEFLFFKTKSQK